MESSFACSQKFILKKSKKANGETTFVYYYIRVTNCPFFGPQTQHYTAGFYAEVAHLNVQDQMRYDDEIYCKTEVGIIGN